MCGCTTFFGMSVDGKVLNFVTKEPESTVQLTLKCKRSKFIHGSELVREVQTISGLDGSYHFDADQTRGCDWTVVDAYKPGFADVGKTGLMVKTAQSDRYVPKYVYVIADTDLSLEQIKNLFAATEGREFEDFFPKFLESKKTAKSPKDFQWIREHYCGKLEQLFADLSEEKKEKYRKPSVNAYRLWAWESYEKDVVDFCAQGN